MAIRKVDPTNSPGTDFTTLAAWEDWAGAQASADPIADCYDGGNLGELYMQNWIATPTELEHPVVRSANGEGHGGSLTAGAYCEMSGSNGLYVYNVSPAEVIGMRVVNASPSTSFPVGLRAGTGQGGVTFDSCVVHFKAESSGNGGYMVYCGSSSASIPENVVQNCLLVSDRASSDEQASVFMQSSAGNTSRFMNNTCVSSATGYVQGFSRFIGLGAGSQTIVSNNIFLAAGGVLSVKIDAFSDGVVVVNENVTSDSVGSIPNKTSAECFSDSDNHDYTPLAGGPQVDAGDDLSAYFTTDLIGTTRPQGEAFDIGAIEFVPTDNTNKVLRTPPAIF